MGNKTLESLDPSEVWDIFEDIFCSTYRASKHEEQIRQKIKSWIKKKNQDLEGEIEIREDDAGNLLLKRPTNPDFTDCSALMLQGHMDMVTETNREGGFDFENEKIPAKIEENGEWVSADGTTLGADNGIGLAIALSILSDPDIKCGPLEMLITVDEETGLTGAFEMNVEELAIESKYLVNVDSEDLGVITVGSAGGGGTVFEKRFSTVSPSSILKNKDKYACVKLKVSGLLGGHSGVDINLPRANAHKIVSRCMLAGIEVLGLEDPDSQFHLCDWSGGTKHNAIPREAVAIILIPKNKKDEFLTAVDEEIGLLKTYYSQETKKGEEIEPQLSVTNTVLDVESALKEKNLLLIAKQDSRNILRMISSIPHGVIKYSPTIKHTVETSNNLAIVELVSEEKILLIHLSSRSNVERELQQFRMYLKELGKMGEWNVRQDPSYPGWDPDLDSELLKFVKEQYEDVLGQEVNLETIHAGLETGVIGSKIPGIQMVSLGPTIQNAHTPDERVEIESVKVVHELLRSVVENFCDIEKTE